MLEREDILSLEFYKKSPFHGSYKGIRYRIEKDEGNQDEKNDVALKCTTWPEPYSFDATADDLKKCYYTSFDEKGLQDIVDHINKLYSGTN